MAKDNIMPRGLVVLGTGAKIYYTESDVISDLKLVSNEVVQVVGKNSSDDGLGYFAIIESTNKNGIQLNNGLYANPIPNTNGSEKLDKGNLNPNLTNAEKIVNALENTIGLKFDSNLLDLSQQGTKLEGKAYLFEGDIYKCIKQTESKTPESDEFEPISNNKLSERLDNLSTRYNGIVLYEAKDDSYPTSITISDSYLNYDLLFIYVNLDGSPTGNMHKFGYVLPVDIHLPGIACCLNQYGIPSPNAIEIKINKSEPTKINISDTGIAIVKLVGVRF